MKVCLLSRYFNLKNAGLGRYSMTLRDGLMRRGFDVVTISEDDMNWVLGGHYILSKYFTFTALGIKMMLPKDCDIYHALHFIEALHLPYGKKPTVVTIHDLIPILHAWRFTKTHYANNKINSLISRMWCKITLKASLKADKIIAVSETTKDELVSLTGISEDKVVVIPNGIKDELRPMKTEKHIPRIGTLSYLDPRKRIELLIEAYKKSKHKGELVIAGDSIEDWYKQRLYDMAKDDKRIKFLGFISDDKLVEFYNSLDLFVFPSVAEGFGLPIVEALACGVPVITFDDAKIPLEVQRHTFIISKKELIRYIENPPKPNPEDIAWASMRRWSNVIDRIIEVYEELIRR